MNGICEQGHVTNFYGHRDFRVADARCGTCGGSVGAAKLICCERCAASDPPDVGGYHYVRLAAKVCRAGHPQRTGRGRRTTTVAESLALEQAAPAEGSEP